MVDFITESRTVNNRRQLWLLAIYAYKKVKTQWPNTINTKDSIGRTGQVSIEDKETEIGVDMAYTEATKKLHHPPEPGLESTGK